MKHCSTQCVGIMSVTADSKKRYESNDGKNDDRRGTVIVQGIMYSERHTAPECKRDANSGYVGLQYQPARTE